MKPLIYTHEDFSADITISETEMRRIHELAVSRLGDAVSLGLDGITIAAEDAEDAECVSRVMEEITEGRHGQWTDAATEDEDDDDVEIDDEVAIAVAVLAYDAEHDEEADVYHAADLRERQGVPGFLAVPADAMAHAGRLLHRGECRAMVAQYLADRGDFID